MDIVLKNKLRAKYVQLNRKFLAEVENGSSWKELQPLMEEMKDIAACMEQIPASGAIIRNMPRENNSEQQAM